MGVKLVVLLPKLFVCIISLNYLEHKTTLPSNVNIQTCQLMFKVIQIIPRPGDTPILSKEEDKYLDKSFRHNLSKDMDSDQYLKFE